MRVSIKGTNIDLSPAIRDYIDKKLVRTTEKFLGRDMEMITLDIEIGKTTRHHHTGKIFRAETNLSVGKELLRAEAIGENLNEAIDLVEAELEREIKKFKEKRRSTMLKSARVIKRK